MHARLRGSKSLLTLLIIKPDLPSLADEIAEPRPDMNIKVAAFTVSEKSINTMKEDKESNLISSIQNENCSITLNFRNAHKFLLFNYKNDKWRLF